MKAVIAYLPGDGIGPEVAGAARAVLEAIAKKYGHEFTFNEALIGAAAIDETGSAFPDETRQICEASDAILFGAVGMPKYDNDPSARVRPEQGILGLRKTLGLYANVRPVMTFPTTPKYSPLKPEIVKGTDIVVVRELIGGIYFGKKGRSEDGKTAFDTADYSVEQIEQILKYAFELSLKRRKKLTVVDKANVLETSRLWRETAQNMEQKYPDVQVEYMFVDNAAMKLIQWPSDFDVIVTENMFGDILTDEASVITGSLGMLPSASIGGTLARREVSDSSRLNGGDAESLLSDGSVPLGTVTTEKGVMRAANKREDPGTSRGSSAVGLYEPIHGSYPQAAGKNFANPIGSILSAALLLLYSFNLQKEHDAIFAAVQKVLEEGYGTEDIVKENPLSTTDLTEKIISTL